VKCGVSERAPSASIGACPRVTWPSESLLLPPGLRCLFGLSGDLNRGRTKGNIKGVPPARPNSWQRRGVWSYRGQRRVRGSCRGQRRGGRGTSCRSPALCRKGSGRSRGGRVGSGGATCPSISVVDLLSICMIVPSKNKERERQQRSSFILQYYYEYFFLIKYGTTTLLRLPFFLGIFLAVLPVVGICNNCQRRTSFARSTNLLSFSVNYIFF
jgi:hypothetical protein